MKILIIKILKNLYNKQKMKLNANGFEMGISLKKKSN